MCGVFAIANALLSIKIEFDISDIARVSRATPSNGTSKAGVIRAIKYYGLNPIIYEGRSDQYSWRWISSRSLDFPIVVLVDNRGHYGTVIGKFGRKIIFVDPSIPSSAYENNVSVLGRGDFINRWKWGGRFYAVCVSK